jgi:hypothetical protein
VPDEQASADAKIAIRGGNRRTELSGFVTENTAEVAFRNKNKRNDN